MTGKPKLVYDSKYNFSEYKNIRNFYNLSFMTKHDRLSKFYHQLTEFRSIVPQTDETENKKRECIKML